MLTAIMKAEMPMPGGRAKGALAIFAEDTVKEFLDSTETGDIAEVTEWPEGDAAKCRQALSNAIHAMWRRDELDMSEFEVRRRGDRVFIMRVESSEDRTARLRREGEAHRDAMRPSAARD